MKWERTTASNDTHWVSVQVAGVLRRLRLLDELPKGVEYTHDDGKMSIIIDPEVFGWILTED